MGAEGAVGGAKESGCCVCIAFVTAGEGAAEGEEGFATGAGGVISATGAEYGAAGTEGFGASFRPSMEAPTIATLTNAMIPLSTFARVSRQ